MTLAPHVVNDLPPKLEVIAANGLAVAEHLDQVIKPSLFVIVIMALQDRWLGFSAKSNFQVRLEANVSCYWLKPVILVDVIFSTIGCKFSNQLEHNN